MNSRNKVIFKGEDCLEKEKVVINKFENIVYHNKNRVDPLFKTAFNIEPIKNKIDAELTIRHDLVHRIGYTKEWELRLIDKEQVESLMRKIDDIVETIKRSINSL